MADPVTDPLADPVAALSRPLSALVRHLQQGGSLAGALQLGPADLDLVYAAGYDVFQQGRFADALKVFGWLAALEPFQTRFHHAVATCLQRLGRHRDAAFSYVLLRMMEPDNPEPQLRLAECLLATGDRAEAADLLDSLLEEADTRPTDSGAPTTRETPTTQAAPASHAAWFQRAEALRTLLRRGEDAAPSDGAGTPTGPRAVAPSILPSSE